MLKKSLSTFMIFSLILINLNAASIAATKKTKNVKTYYGNVSYTKKTAAKKQNKNKVENNEFNIPLIEDEAINTLRTNGYTKITYKNNQINEELPKELATKKEQKKKYKKEYIQDEEIIFTENNVDFEKPVYKGIERTDTGVEVVLKPVKKIRTKNSRLKISETDEAYKVALPELGQVVEFKVVKDVKKDGKIVIPKNSRVIAKIGEVSPRAMGGAPAEMTIEKFRVLDANGKTINLSGNLNSSGYTLAPWIGLAELATTPFLFGLAVPLLRVLPGGQAVVTPRKNYKVYY